MITHTFRNPKHHILSYPFPKELSIHPSSISVTSNLLVFIAELQPQSVWICPVAEFPAVPPPPPPTLPSTQLYFSVSFKLLYSELQSERNSWKFPCAADYIPYYPTQEKDRPCKVFNSNFLLEYEFLHSRTIFLWWKEEAKFKNLERLNWNLSYHQYTIRTVLESPTGFVLADL